MLQRNGVRHFGHEFRESGRAEDSIVANFLHLEVTNANTKAIARNFDTSWQRLETLDG